MLNQIWDVQGNLFLKKDGSVFAVYEVPSKIINSIDDQAKEQFKELTYASLRSLQSYHDFDLRTVPIHQNLRKRYEKLALDVDWDSAGADLADYVLQGQVAYLESSIGRLYDYHHYLIVPLKSLNVSPDLKTVTKSSLDNISKSVMNIFGIQVAVEKDWHLDYKIQEEALRNSLSLIEASPLSRQETLFLLRYHFLRGQYYDQEYEVTLLENNIENVDETNIEFEQVNVLKLSNETESSFVAFLPVNRIPENVSYLHLQEEIQTMNFPVESIYKTKFSVGKGITSLFGKSQRARQKMKNIRDEAEETENVQKGSVERSLFLIEDLQAKFDEEEPLVSYLQTLVLTGSSLEELKERYELLYSHLNQIGVEVVRANADQVYLFYKTRIGELLTGTDKNFVQSMSLQAFAEHLFFMRRKVGSEIGFEIGRVDNQIDSWHGQFQEAIFASNNPVYLNLYQANKLGVKGKNTNNPHVGITGATGSGKSFLTKLLFTYQSFLLGKLLYVDPKSEMRQQYMKVLAKLKREGRFEELQRYIESIEFVTLDAKNPDNYGVLDPIVFLKGQEATDLADSMIDGLLGKDNNTVVQEGYLASIERVLARREAGERVGMLQVFEDMQESLSDDVVNAGKLLVRLVKNSILSLCFSNGENESINLENKITILEIAGLDLPKQDNAQIAISKSQQKSLIVMYALGYFCKRFGEQDRSEETIIFFDEAWFFNSTAVGRSILMSLKRIGRSFNNFMVYITQSVKDLETEDDSTGFGTVFAFLEPSEVDDILRYLHLPVIESTRKWLMNMTMGQCIYLDTSGRRERITVEGMFPEIIELFDTVETNLQSVS
ncbi:ATP-binding protein [Streptococcus danieliae]|uniref:ATP-binding protein n=1 Tax=Streptococcus danieliae TaxID=747656 RepID=UPI0026ED0B71|nr:ATP-binding protein [Streptococcus danieliae]